MHIILGVKHLFIVCVLIKLITCERESTSSDAFSRVRFVQYQPIKTKKLESSSSNDAEIYKELETKGSQHYGVSVPQENPNSYENDPDYKPVPKNYAFSYAIKDRNSGDDFSHTQAHNGQATKGEYRVKLPDGRIQVVTYTADNAGYRADIRYDKDEIEEQPNNDVYVTKDFFGQTLPTSIKKAPIINLNSASNSFTPKLFNKGSDSKKVFEKDSSESPLLYFNEIRSFDGVSSTTNKPTSYETVENIDEEQFPYSKKLLADVNYLLKYVTPTTESKTENYQDLVDFARANNFEENHHYDENLKQPPALQHNNAPPFSLPNDFPYKFSDEISPKGDEYSKEISNQEPFKLDEPTLKYIQYENPQPIREILRTEKQHYKPSDSEKLKYNNPQRNFRLGRTQYEGQRNEHNAETPNYSNFQHLQEVTYDKFRGGSEEQNYDNLKPQQDYNYPQPEEPNYDEPGPNTRGNLVVTAKPILIDKSKYNSDSNEASKFEMADFIPSKPDPTQFEIPNYNSIAKLIPVTPSTIQQGRNDGEPQIQFAKIEIPQYIHIHKYEGSGEQGGNGRPKELIYYTPLQIPIANSVAYMEQGNANTNNSSPHYATLTPSYITMTEHPRSNPTEIPPYIQNNVDGMDIAEKLQNITKFKENYIEPTTPLAPTTSAETGGNYEHFFHNNNRESDFPLKNAVPPRQSHETRENYMGADLPPFDPRTYSGYFDFLPSAEVDSDHEKPINQPEPNYPTTPDYSERPKIELPQYYYDFATATPNNKYVNSAESNAGSPPSNSAFDFDHLRNLSFHSMAYLRPLHKERVYIHHNSQPTPLADDQYNNFPTTTISSKRNNHRDAEVQIIKSISSTIPSELLNDYDNQLTSPSYAPRGGDSHNADSERKNVKIIRSDTEPKISKILVKKVQSALSTNAKVYLKNPPTQQQKNTAR